MIHATDPRSVSPDRYLPRSVEAQFDAADFTGTRTGRWHARLRTIAKRGREKCMSLLGASFFWGCPSFLELERQSPVHLRLGPGVSRDSDSFWAVSEWWM
jgi:hypothetical protein